MAWQDHLKENVRTVAGILGAPIGKTGRRSHNLTAQKAQFQNQVIDIDRILPTDVYETFKRLLPAERSRPYGGNPPISARNILAAMIYLEHHHKPWTHTASIRRLSGHSQESSARMEASRRMGSYLVRGTRHGR